MSFHINIELKARSSRIEETRRFLEENATEKKGLDHQIDTYFNSDFGRLKLREGNIENSLIFYKREDQAGAKQSDVNLVQTTGVDGLKELLTRSNGIKAVVDKKREIYFIDNVKFHIDEVKELGNFIEIEAISYEGCTVEELQSQCDKYIDLFKIEEDDFVDVSYSDLILEK